MLNQYTAIVPDTKTDEHRIATFCECFG